MIAGDTELAGIVVGNMRRRLEAYFPIVILVLMTQLLAPISAARVTAQMALGPLSANAICFGEHPAAGQPDDPSRSPIALHECCAVCAIASGAAAVLDPPSPLFVTLQRRYQKISWRNVADQAETVRIGSNTQARAPPATS